jgi:hypothetical protein
MAYNIRPLSFAEVLDRSFQVLRDNFVLLVSISLIVWVPYGVLADFLATRSISAMLIMVAFVWVFVPLGTAAATFAIADLFLGKETTIGGAYSAMLEILVPMVGTYLMLGFFVILGLIALLIPGIYLAVCWYFALVVMVIERRFGLNALGRSRALVRGNWWPTLGIMVVAGLIAQIPSYGVNLIWSYIPVLGPILSAATEGVFATYPMVVAVVYYFDRRCRLEDFDVRLLAEQIRAEGAPGAVSPTTTVG